MSFDQIIALIGCIVGTIGVMLAIISFIYSIKKDHKEIHQFREEQIKQLFDDLIGIMSRGMRGTYIPGMSEEAGNQLKDRVWSTLRWHLLPDERSVKDQQVHDIAQSLKEESKR